MSRWARLLSRRKRMMEDLYQDIRDYIERETQDNIERGMPPDEARYAALRKFGNVIRIKEETRDVWSFVWLEQLWQDIRFSVRMLAKSAGFTAVAVISLALGIGANTAVFSLLDVLLLRNLPVWRPDRLVELSVLRGGNKIPFSFPMFREIARGQKVFSGLIAWTPGQLVNVEISGVLMQADLRIVTGNYFPVLGAVPFRGRLITPDDMNLDKPGTSPVAVLSYGFWQRRFGGTSDAVGKEIVIDGQPYTIVGVTGRWFTGMATGDPADVTVPMKSTDERSLLWVRLTGRLEDHTTVSQARAQLQTFWPEVLRRTVSTETPGLRRQAFLSMGMDVAPAATGVNAVLRSHFTRPLYVLWGMVGLILLVACVNLASLMLARAAVRSPERSVRLALGASRWALARHELTQSLVLSTFGALLGLAFAYAGARLLVNLLTEGYGGPVVFDLRPDWRVLSLTAVVALLTGLLFGLPPAWRSSRTEPGAAMQNIRTVGGTAGKLGSVLIVTQIALSLVLFIGAGLLSRSFQKLCSVDPATEESVLELGLYPKPGGYQSLDVNSYHRELLERISSLPGVDSVSFSASSIGDPHGWVDTASTMSDASNPAASIVAKVARVSPGFMRTLGISLIRGRDFDWTDDERHPRVVIINQGLADRLFPSHNALGQRIRFSFMPQYQNLEVVGIVENARIFDLHNADLLIIYLPLQQLPPLGSDLTVLIVRTHQTPEALARAVEREIESLGHEYPVSTKTLKQVISHALVEDRVVAMLSGFFAVLALLLASVGVYGVMSYTVTQRSHELGIRVALGAQRASVLWLVLREAFVLGALGIALGIPCAQAASRLIASMLFGISPRNLPILVFASVAMVAVALMAGYVPARRAARADPMTSLRCD